jgi:signal transduction histidine kinase
MRGREGGVQGHGALTARPNETRRIIEAADAARRALARDIHDGAQQQLIVCLTELQRAQYKWPDEPDQAKELLDRGVRTAESSLHSLRELVAGIHPALLTHRGLGAAVVDMAARQPLPVAVEMTDQRFPAPVEASLFFFVAEALSNIVKHAQASHAAVLIAVDGHRLTVTVTDDGMGGARPTDRGSGLPGLVDRIAALNGTLSVTSEPSAGTSLRADVPVPALTAA